MKRKLLVVVTGLLVIVAVLGGIKALQIRALINAGGSFSVPPETVSAAEVRQEKWESLLATVGSVAAVQGVRSPSRREERRPRGRCSCTSIRRPRKRS